MARAPVRVLPWLRPRPRHATALRATPTWHMRSDCPRRFQSSETSHKSSSSGGGSGNKNGDANSDSDPNCAPRPADAHPGSDANAGKETGSAVPDSSAGAAVATAKAPLWRRLGPLTRAADGYTRAQRKRPYWTQLCGALVIYFCADVSAQRMSEEDYAPARTARSLVIGALSAIPSYKWFIFLSQHFNYSSRLVSLGVKIVVNQTCFTPIFNSYFFGMQALLAGETLEQVWERIKRTVPTSFVNSCKLWPAVTAFSFTFIPMEHRHMFSGVVAVGWQTYLAFLNRLAEEAEREKAIVKTGAPLLESPTSQAGTAKMAAIDGL